MCIAGYFNSNGQGVRLSKAAVFHPGQGAGQSDVLSLAGGEPYMADGPAAVRAMGLSFRPPDGEEWRMAMIDIPVFVVKDPEGFYRAIARLAARPRDRQA